MADHNYGKPLLRLIQLRQLIRFRRLSGITIWGPRLRGEMKLPLLSIDLIVLKELQKGEVILNFQSATGSSSHKGFIQNADNQALPGYAIGLLCHFYGF